MTPIDTVEKLLHAFVKKGVVEGTDLEILADALEEAGEAKSRVGTLRAYAAHRGKTTVHYGHLWRFVREWPDEWDDDWEGLMLAGNPVILRGSADQCFVLADSTRHLHLFGSAERERLDSATTGDLYTTGDALVLGRLTDGQIVCVGNDWYRPFTPRFEADHE